eukprot:2101260-Rhodomonas_salina.5
MLTSQFPGIQPAHRRDPAVDSDGERIARRAAAARQPALWPDPVQSGGVAGAPTARHLRQQVPRLSPRLLQHQRAAPFPVGRAALARRKRPRVSDPPVSQRRVGLVHDPQLRARLGQLRHQVSAMPAGILPRRAPRRVLAVPVDVDRGRAPLARSGHRRGVRSLGIDASAGVLRGVCCFTRRTRCDAVSDVCDGALRTGPRRSSSSSVGNRDRWRMTWMPVDRAQIGSRARRGL